MRGSDTFNVTPAACGRDLHRWWRSGRREARRPAQDHRRRQPGHLQRRSRDRPGRLPGRGQPAGELRSHRVIGNRLAAVPPSSTAPMDRMRSRSSRGTSTYNAAADGNQDFTVSVNTGPDLLFLNVASLDHQLAERQRPDHAANAGAQQRSLGRRRDDQWRAACCRHRPADRADPRDRLPRSWSTHPVRPDGGTLTHSRGLDGDHGHRSRC